MMVGLRLLFWLTVITIGVLLPLPCQSTASSSSNNNSNNNEDRRTLQQQEDNDDNLYDPCSLCQGLPILFDKRVPNLDGSTNYIPTCNEIDLYYRYNFTTAEVEQKQEDVNQQTQTTNANANANANETTFPIIHNYRTPGAATTCKNDFGYNYYFDICCQPSIPKYECEQNIHQIVIDNGVYNTVVPPIIGNMNNEDEIVVVSVFIQYEALEHIEVGEGTATIFVSMLFKWKDERLKWTVDDDMCSNIINVWTGHDLETTTIWIPDFDVLNRIEGVQSMPEYKAIVYSDGSVEWAISGGLKAFCAFTGLAKIPFDTIGCQMLFSAGSRPSGIVYRLENPDYVFFGGFEVTYNEWRPVPELGKQGYTFNEGVIYYNLFFQRSTRHYISNIVLPTIILTYLSFFTFLLDLRIGERLGFGMALALVVVAQQIVTSGLTPISDQRLWLDKFVSWSFYWVLFGVIQSVCIGFLYYIREDRVARKENKRLSMMSRSARDSMMRRARAAAATEEEAAEREEEEMMLTDSTLVEETGKGCCGNCLYTFSFRRMDIISLSIAVITYTIFIVLMLYSGTSDLWLTNEPNWFDESNQIYLQQTYDNNDPNSR